MSFRSRDGCPLLCIGLRLSEETRHRARPEKWQQVISSIVEGEEEHMDCRL